MGSEYHGHGFQAGNHARFQGAGIAAQTRDRIIEILKGEQDHALSLADLIEIVGPHVSQEEALANCHTQRKVWDSLASLPESMRGEQAVRLFIRQQVNLLTERRSVLTWGHRSDPSMRMVKWTGLQKGQRIKTCSVCGKSPLDSQDRMRKVVSFERIGVKARGERVIATSTTLCMSCGMSEVDAIKHNNQ